MTASSRRLPHIYTEGRWLFLTWHLYGVLRPSEVAPPGKATSGEAFVLMDRRLDNATTGPRFLLKEEIADLVVSSLIYGAAVGNYDLGPFVIMSNHVHVLLLPKVPVSRLMKSLKGYTAREANRILGRTGTSFWQKESYDHWVRDGEEWRRIRAYIEMNPVKAGLVTSPETYRWSSAFAVDTTVDAARLEACATTTGGGLNN
jgi:putative transposase